MTNERDARLVQAALRGDVDSFTDLCTRYYSAMVAIAHAILGDPHLAEDAAQDTFAKACKALPKLNEHGRFGHWLAAICRNQARDMAGRTKKQQALTDDVAFAQPVAEPADLESLRQAIETLPPDAREVIYLRYYDQMSYRQMASVLGVSVEAVNGRLRRAKRALAGYLRRQAGIGEQS